MLGTIGAPNRANLPVRLPLRFDVFRLRAGRRFEGVDGAARRVSTELSQMASAALDFVVDSSALSSWTAPRAELDGWVLRKRKVGADDPRRFLWPRNLGGAFVVSLAFHAAALAALYELQFSRRAAHWELRVPKGHNSVALAASVSSPRTEAERRIRIEPPTTEAVDEPPSQREVETPSPTAAEFTSARVDARVPPPTEIARATSEERPAPPEKPLTTPRKRTSDAKVAPLETVVRFESAASAPSTASSGAATSTTPAVLLEVRPIYPPAALAERKQGVVRLRVRVNEQGECVAASVHQSSGHAVLDQAALDVIYRWRWAPSDGRNGVAMEFVTPITFEIVVRN